MNTLFLQLVLICLFLDATELVDVIIASHHLKQQSFIMPLVCMCELMTWMHALFINLSIFCLFIYIYFIKYIYI